MKPHRAINWRRAAGTALMMVVLSASSLQPARAQSQGEQPPDVQQLQKKLEQMEKQMQEQRERMEKQMQELKQQISAMQNPQGPEPDLTIGGEPSHIVNEQTAEKATPAEKTTTAAHGTALDLYGFVMLDSGYDFGTNDPNWFDTMRPTKLNAFPGEFAPDGKFWFGVRQTRFGVKTSTPTPLGDLKTHFEWELFGTGVDAGQTTLRLRHAYGELGAFGAGQTWSPFMDIDVFPNSLEYWGPSGMVFYRNVQVRWMPLRGERTKVTIAAERPGATADQGQYSDFIELQDVRPRFNVPDISGNVRFIRKWGYVQMAGIFRKIGWVQTQPSQFNLSGTAYGWGVNLTSNFQLGKNDVGKFEVVYGHGISNYMNDATTDIGIQNNSGNPVAPIKGVALPVLGVVSFIDHNWSPRFQSSIGYSMVNMENSDGDLPAAFHQGHYALANILFHPVKAVTVGSEFQFGRRVNFSDGFNTNDYRVQFSFKYDWSKTFGGEY